MPDLPLPGQLVAGKYLAQEELGRGGMGRVMAARHLSLDRPVALKFLSGAELDELALERFVREARAAAQIESEHVARVMDAARLETGEPYIVMERLTGVNLKGLLARDGQLPVAVAVDYLLQACDAIAEAHARGIVHRDLKPSNLFLCDRADGTRVVKVLDFGVSKMRRDPALEGAETTSAEVLLGSPQYMAPEQIRSAKYADARSDIWSLGGILYELLAGQPAYRAETLPGLLASIVADEPRPLALFRTDVPVALQSAVRRCLEKDPGRRFQSVAELARALAPFAPAARTALIERISRFSSGGAKPTPPVVRAGPRLEGKVSRLGALAVVLILLTLGLASLRQPSPPLVASEVPAPPRPAAGADRAAPESSTFQRALVGPLAGELSPQARTEKSDAVSAGRSRAAGYTDPRPPRAIRVAAPVRAGDAPSATAAAAASLAAAATGSVAPAPSGALAPPALETPPASEPATAPRAPIAAPAPPQRPRNPLDVFSDPR